MSPLDRFELGHELGAGGMGRVVRAVDKQTGDVVAVKLVVNGGDDDDTGETAARFAREVRAASALDHENICQVVACGRAPQLLFMAMELIDGPSVQRLQKKKKLPLPLAVDVVRQLCLALQHAHDHGVIHRDVKPANLMMTSDGIVKLVDFGIARSLSDQTITQTGAIVGTPSYMSPEQVTGGVVDGRADQYAAATTLYTLAAGRMRFAGVEPTSVLMKVAHEPTPTLFESVPAASPGLARVLARATRLAPSGRFSTCGALAAALVETDEWQVLRSADEARALMATFLTADSADVVDDLGHRLHARHQARAVALEQAGAVDAARLARRAASLSTSDDTLIAEPADTPAITDALAAFESTPTSAGVLKRLADLHRANGNPRLAAAFLLRYLQERPNDSHAALQLDALVDGAGAQRRVPDRLSTRDIVDGIATGGAAGAAGVPTRHRPPPVHNKPIAQPLRSSQTSSLASSMTAAAPSVLVVDAGNSSVRMPALLWALGAIVVAGLALAFFSRFVKSTVDDVQMTMSDAEQSVGRYEKNNAARSAGNALVEARALAARGNHQAVITTVNRLMAAQPPAELGLEAMLLRAAARESLGDELSARLDLEAFLRESPVNEPRRPSARARLDALYAKLGPPPSSSAILPPSSGALPPTGGLR